MKTIKASNIDDTASELIQNARSKIQDQLSKLINDIYITEKILED